MSELVFTPSDFVAVLNQTLEYAYPLAYIEGELTNFRISRNRWVYFDIKDETASVKCFGTIYQLPGPLEDGMMVRIAAQPRLHPLYNFSLTIQSIIPVGEGSLKKAADLLFNKLEKEGLFDEIRKRSIPSAPTRIGLVTSKQAAAYTDFIKILNARWGGIHISHIDVQVQGEQAITDITQAIDHLNQLGEPLEVIVLIRGGGSTEDLAVFNTEQVTRAVAASRIPTIVAIGHEVDVSLAERAADLRASTPSNAAELLVPDKQAVSQALRTQYKQLQETIKMQFTTGQDKVIDRHKQLRDYVTQVFFNAEHIFTRQRALLEALSPQAALKRGYAVIKAEGNVIRSVKSLTTGQRLHIQLYDGTAEAEVSEVQ